jgi:pyruvate-formate lyase
LVPQTTPERPFETELRFTETYRRYRDAHPALREARCLRVQYPETLLSIEDDDLLAGRVRPRLVGFSPDEWGTAAFGYYHLPQAIREAVESYDLDPEMRREVEAMVAFWDEESTAAKLRRAYSEEMAHHLPSDDWMNTYGVAFPLYRLTGGTVDYAKLVRLGIPGLAADVRRRWARALEAGDDAELFEGMLMALDVLADVVRHYEVQARAMAAAAGDPARRAELSAMADTLGCLLLAPPPTFRAAAQLVWLYGLVGDVRNYGRMDVTLGPLLAHDLDTGALTETEALRLLQSLWQLMADRETRVHNRVIVGGLGRPNEADADRFALLAMEASRTVLEPEPQLSLRFYEGQHPALVAKALDVIGEGRTFPILYNDDVNVPSVMATFGFSRAEAEQYVPFGCGEYILEHRSFGTPSGVINLLKALEVTLHDGTDPMTGQPMGLALGRLEDFDTFEDLWAAYARQVEHFVRLMAEQEALEYRVAAGEAPFLFLSLLYDDCLERGEGVFDGGVRYLGGTLETYGNTNAADSLMAIKDLVYDRQVLTPTQLLEALAADFEGYDRERRLLLDAPKYGNDDDRADAMLCRVHEHVCTVTRAQAERVGLHSYLVVVINNAANTLLGKWTAASADGRRARQPMNNGNAPSSGSDRKGVTAMLNSMVKPSTAVHAGAVQNMKFSPELFRTRRAELEALLETYFANGGAQAMITVVSRGDLERAMETPEAYGHLFVRVGGFSARFVDLGRDVQLEILQRTLY